MVFKYRFIVGLAKIKNHGNTLVKFTVHHIHKVN